MEYNNVNHNLQRNSSISTSNNSQVLTLTSPSVTSTNKDLCSLFSPIHERIKYFDLSKTQSRAVRCSSYRMKSQIKLLANSTCHSSILEYLFKYKDMKEVLSAMDIFIHFPTQEITRQNKCQTIFLDKLVLKPKFGNKLMINDYFLNVGVSHPSTSDIDKIYNGVSKSTFLEHTIKHFMK